ncbi:hypothetical protein CLOSTHATH_06324, partial [Hungatella hathewayi DSM 13479]
MSFFYNTKRPVSGIVSVTTRKEIRNMKVLNREDYQEIRSWIHRNARQLELSVWNYFFENGSREAVIDALSYYQNEDGGFGNAVEPDVWNPESSPYATMVVTGILRR